jgi:hypothetical protein
MKAVVGSSRSLVHSVGVGIATWDNTGPTIGSYVSDPSVVSPPYPTPGSSGVSAFIVFLITFR